MRTSNPSEIDRNVSAIRRAKSSSCASPGRRRGKRAASSSSSCAARVPVKASGASVVRTGAGCAESEKAQTMTASTTPASAAR